MGQRSVQMVIAALLVAIGLVATGCVGDQGEQSDLTGSDAYDEAPAEAQDVIIKGLETMFTWFPERDASPLDAYNRALPFLGQAFRDGANNKLERGNSVWWQEWKAKKAEVTADALLVDAEHPEDTPDTVQRAVVLTQTVKAPDGKQLDSSTMEVDRVVAKKSPEGWRVQEINFFPENEFRAQTCPPGQSHQPPPDGPCTPNPPPPPKQCPDGSTVAPDQVCPPPKTGPQTKQCPDRTTVPAGATCPATGPTTPQTPQTKQCPDGKTIPADQTCPTTTGPTTTQCPDGSTVPAGQPCPTPKPTQCPDGTTVPAGQTCPSGPPPTQCPNGTTVPAGQTCPTPEPTQCLDGTTVPAGQTCPIRIPCPDGSTVTLGETCPPVECPDGSTVIPPLPCPIPIPIECPNGSTVYSPESCPPPINCWNGTTVYSPDSCPPEPQCSSSEVLKPSGCVNKCSLPEYASDPSCVVIQVAPPPPPARKCSGEFCWDPNAPPKPLPPPLEAPKIKCSDGRIVFHENECNPTPES